MYDILYYFCYVYLNCSLKQITRLVWQIKTTIATATTTTIAPIFASKSNNNKKIFNKETSKKCKIEEEEKVNGTENDTRSIYKT